jgi:hypothetical protein
MLGLSYVQVLRAIDRKYVASSRERSWDESRHVIEIENAANVHLSTGEHSCAQRHQLHSPGPEDVRPAMPIAGLVREEIKQIELLKNAWAKGGGSKSTTMCEFIRAHLSVAADMHDGEGHPNRRSKLVAMAKKVERQRNQAKSTANRWTRRIDRADHELLTFAISWLPYGGGPEDEILVNFGMTTQRYLSRLREVVDRQRHLIHPTVAERLIALCEQSSAVQ